MATTAESRSRVTAGREHAGAEPSPRGWRRWLIVAAAVGVVVYLVPLFHVVPLGEGEVGRGGDTAAFDPESFVEELWSARLPALAAEREVPDAADVVAAVGDDPVGAAERFGNRVGLGGKASCLVSGRGQVSAVERGRVEIELDGGGAVSIRTGPVFGNAVRDGSGLVDVSDFANSQDFNAVSTVINRRVEELVLPELVEGAAPGVAIGFFGGVELPEPGAAARRASVEVVPVAIEFP